MSGRQVRWLLCATAAFLSQAACSTQPPAARTENTRDASPRAFDGQWAYATKCGFGHFANISLKQTGSEMSGTWSEGTTLRGSDGLIKGTVRAGKLFIQYCGNDEASGYPVCPEFGGESDYFMRNGADLVRFQKYG
ncbi:MAG TPA: hypothetical protein VGD42_13345, partial [Lysobacter sp.]